VLWAVCTVSEEFADIRVEICPPEFTFGSCFRTGNFDAGSRVNSQASPLLLWLQKSFAHTTLIEIAPRGS
jgi:hypothetical protein